MSKAFITGITGQDGSYLAEFLLSKGYEVGGLVRRVSISNLSRIKHIENKLKLYYGDLSDYSSILKAIKDFNPDEVYNLGAQSFVQTSWKVPEYTSNVTGLGVERVLSACLYINPKIRFYQASTSEMFGKVREVPQNEVTPFYPRSPYGVAKVYGHWITINYRESYNMFAVSGICFNHESPRRGIEFVTRKITDGVARIVNNIDEYLYLGNLDSKRDWGYAGDYVKAMWMMLQQPTPEDFVIGTGETHSIREFCDIAFKQVSLDYKDYVRQDERFMRPAEVDLLLADPKKISILLDWKPKTSFEELVKMMVGSDMNKYGDY